MSQFVDYQALSQLSLSSSSLESAGSLEIFYWFGSELRSDLLLPAEKPIEDSVRGVPKDLSTYKIMNDK